VTAAELEAVRTPTGPAFADAVTFAFGDGAAQLYGLARIGISPGEDGAGRRASALAVLFAGREPVAAIARGALEVSDGTGWDDVAAGGLRMGIEEPLRAWTVAMEGERHGFELRFEATSPPALIAAGDAVARAGGMEGYEQLCAVSGTVRAGGGAVQVHCPGQRGHAWGEPDWDRIESSRTVTAWLDHGGITLTSVRPPGAPHADELVWAAMLAGDGVLPIDEPRLSTTYDADGRQRRVGLELHGHEDVRGSGEVLCGSTLDLGQLRLDCSFFRWRIDGEAGVGRYDVLRRA
jgi:hypothetical protein